MIGGGDTTKEDSIRRIGIVAHSAEGGALCFTTVCREGQLRLGDHHHPEIVMSAVPMGASMAAWHAGEHQEIADNLMAGIQQVDSAGADFFVCPDNTAHIVLEQAAGAFPIPGLHIAEVVASEMNVRGFCSAGLLGTMWTMSGHVYPDALEKRGCSVITPDQDFQQAIDVAIFKELCLGRFEAETILLFQQATNTLRESGADCVILGCTEIPLIITDANSSLPVLDSTRLLARRAVDTALMPDLPETEGGWLST